MQLLITILTLAAPVLLLPALKERQVLLHRETIFENRNQLECAERAGEHACFTADAEGFIDTDHPLFLDDSKNRTGGSAGGIFAVRHWTGTGPWGVRTR